MVRDRFLSNDTLGWNASVWCRSADVQLTFDSRLNMVCYENNFGEKLQFFVWRNTNIFKIKTTKKNIFVLEIEKMKCDLLKFTFKTACEKKGKKTVAERTIKVECFSGIPQRSIRFYFWQFRQAKRTRLKGLHKTFWATTKKCENKNLS